MKKLIVIGLTVTSMIAFYLAIKLTGSAAAKIGCFTSIGFFGFLCYYYTRDV